MQYTVGAYVQKAIEGFFGMFGDSTEDGIKNVSKFANYAGSAMTLVAQYISNLVQTAAVYISALPDIFAAGFDALPGIAYNAVERAKGALLTFADDWKAGMNSLFGTEFSVAAISPIDQVQLVDSTKKLKDVLGGVSQKVAAIDKETVKGMKATIASIGKVAEESKRAVGKLS